MRDFIHIEDCVDGVLKTMDSIDDGGALNLSTGVPTSFKELVRLASKIVGFSPDVLGLSDKPEGVFARAGDTKKQASMGVTHTIELDRGIKKSLDFIQSH